MIQTIQFSHVKIPVTSTVSVQIENLLLQPNIYLLSGKNGSGKSVFLRYLAQPNEQVSPKAKILYLTNEEIAMPYLTMKENVQLAQEIFGIKQPADYSLFDPQHLQTLGKQSSLGMRHKVGLSLALVERFWDIILLDESLSNIDTESRRKIVDALSTRAKEGSIILLVDHQINDVKVPMKQLYIEEGRVYEKE